MPGTVKDCDRVTVCAASLTTPGTVFVPIVHAAVCVSAGTSANVPVNVTGVLTV